MTGETQREPSGWTPDTLKILEDEKIAAARELFAAEIKRLDEALAASAHATQLLAAATQLAQEKFEATVERDSVKQNEFRGSLEDLGKTMATRREAEAGFAAVNARIDEIAKLEAAWRDDIQKQMGDLRSRLDIGPAALATLTNQNAIQQGRQQGIGVSANVVVIALTILVAAIAAAAAVIIATHS